MIDLLQRHSDDEYSENAITTLIGVLLCFYRPWKLVEGFSHLDKQKTAIQIIQKLLPMFPPDDIRRTRVLVGAMEFHFDHEVRYWTLKHIPGMLHDTPEMSALHSGISHKLLVADPLSIRIIAGKTQDLHRLSPLGSATRSKVTPTSLAMYQRGMFISWVSILRDLGYNRDEFVRAEMDRSALSEDGWTHESLTVLLDCQFTPSEEGTQSRYLSCERCGVEEHGWTVMIDLEWRKHLRDIKLGRISRSKASPIHSMGGTDNIRSTTLDFGNNLEDSHTDINFNRGSSADYCSMPVQPIPIPFPYNIVCSTRCTDGVCVARLFDNQELDDPTFPSLVVDEMEQDELENNDGKIRAMPGSFID